MNISSLIKLVPIGYSVGVGSCLVDSLIKIREGNCVTMKVIIPEGEKGEFVVCNGKVHRAKWGKAQGDKAWEKMLEEVKSSEKLVHVLFFPPPEEISLLEEMSADALVVSDVTTGYIASYGIVSLGKAVLGFLHRLEAMGIEVRDFGLEVSEGVATLKLEIVGEVPWDRIVEVAMEYFRDYGVERILPG